MIAGEAATV